MHSVLQLANNGVLEIDAMPDPQFAGEKADINRSTLRLH